MILRAELAAAEKLQQREADAVRAEKDRDDLKAALEVMQMQNQMLSRRMESSQQEARELLETNKRLLEMERAERILAVSRMESENRTLIEAQERSQQELTKEREELRAAMKRMEQEKNELSKRVHATEEKASQEAIAVDLQKKEFHESIKRLEMEKLSLAARVQDNETQSKLATEAVALQLAKERDEMRERMQKMEDDKNLIAKTLAETDAQAKAQAETLAAQLAFEKEALQQSLERMDMEKKELASHLKAAELNTKAQAQAVSEQLAKERDELRAAIDKMEQEKMNLANRLDENEAQVQRASGDMQKAVSEQLAKERQELQEKIEQMAKEKEEMAEQLRATEKTAQQREEVMETRLAREREDLKAAVQRMREEIAAERHQAKDQNNSNSQASLKQSKSLFDMLGEAKSEAEANAALDNGSGGPPLTRKLSRQLSKHNMVPHTISAIPEGDDEDHGDFMDWSDDESVASRASFRNNFRPKTVAVAAGAGAVSTADAAAAAMAAVGGSSDELTMAQAAEAAAARGTSSSSENQHQQPQQTQPQQQPKQPKQKTPDPFEELPAPHAAAASGDVARLEVLADLELSLLSSYDAAHRSPLFYAVAYGQEDVARYLISKCPEMADAVDVHGDSPLHAAASAGSLGCLEIIFSTAIAEGIERDANAKNNMQMTPAHLARSTEVLEVLFSHGADLSSLDANGRTPLFVACAMNREDCAEFIIGCLDKEGKSLYQKDARGDTPLHAAACNGSVDCLLLLLQFGVDPRIINAKGLKAIDLAIRNKQKKCRDLLAEYHLHFCTSSEFDSVLFLATLEGHRQVREAHSNANHPPPAADAPESASYEIIKKTNSFRDDPNAQKTLKHVQSLFSLKTAKSLRMQRWGEWIAYEDQTKPNSTYWYNQSTSSGQWDKPDEVTLMQQQGIGGISGTSSESSPGLTSKMSMRLKKRGDWLEYKTEAGQIFFYNEKNGEFQWEMPDELANASSSSSPPKNKSPDKNTKTKGSSSSSSPSSSTSPSAAGAVSSSTTTTAEGMDDHRSSGIDTGDWKPYKDPDSGSIFWYNHVTQVSQWECPLQNVQMSPGQVSMGAEHGGEDYDYNNEQHGYGYEHEEEVTNVYNDDDLGL